MMVRQRTKIRSDNVRAAILKELRRSKQMRTADIKDKMHDVAADLNLEFRGRAVSHCLTALRREGLATNETRGSWRITAKGLSADSK